MRVEATLELNERSGKFWNDRLAKHEAADRQNRLHVRVSRGKRTRATRFIYVADVHTAPKQPRPPGKVAVGSAAWPARAQFGKSFRSTSLSNRLRPHNTEVDTLEDHRQRCNTLCPNALCLPHQLRWPLWPARIRSACGLASDRDRAGRRRLRPRPAGAACGGSTPPPLRLALVRSLRGSVQVVPTRPQIARQAATPANTARRPSISRSQSRSWFQVGTVRDASFSRDSA